MRSPLSQAPGPVDGAEGVTKTAINPKKDAQAVLTYIKQVYLSLCLDDALSLRIFYKEIYQFVFSLFFNR